MTAKPQPPVIQISGSPASGKTTVCRMLLNGLESKTILAIDASADGYLAESYGVSHPVTMADLIRQMDSQSFNREGTDWALQDLPVSLTDVPSEAEMLVIGNLPGALSENQRSLMDYALPRLLSLYDLVIIDDGSSQFEALLSSVEMRHLLVITPEDERYCQTVPYEKAVFILSKAGKSDAIPPTAVEQIQTGHWKLLGKLPPLSPAETRIKELPKYFEECINKLDLPLQIRSQFSF